MYTNPDAKPLRPLTYKKWNGSVNMQKAVEAVRNKSLSVRRAAEMHGVPRATLHDRASGKVQADACSGPRKYLTTHEEEELLNFLYGCARIGYPRTRKQVLCIVQEYLFRKGLNTVVCYGWWQRFRQRHNSLSMRTAAPLGLPRAQAMDRDTMTRYFDILECALSENGLLDRPSQIFNCDESGMPLSPKPPKIIAKKGEKNPSYVTGDTKTQISILACVNAAGQWIPPMVIFDRKSLKPALTIGEVPNTFYGLSSKGWMDTLLFEKWFTEHFLCYAPSQRPLLLLMDGCSSHFCPDMIRIAAKEQVVLFVLPPHTTQISQPLDKGVFGALKTGWREVCHKFTITNTGRVVTRWDFSQLFCEAWDNCMTIKNIKAGFRVTGVYPFDRSAIVLPDENFKTFEPELLSSASGISYIPFYTDSELATPKKSVRVQESSSDSDDSLSVGITVTKSRGKKPLATPAKALPYSSKFEQLLQLPKLPSKIPTKRGKSCGRVITSRQAIADLDAKEAEKKAADALKLQKQRQREAAKVQKQRQQEETKLQKLRKKEMVKTRTSTYHPTSCMKGTTAFFYPLPISIIHALLLLHVGSKSVRTENRPHFKGILYVTCTIMYNLKQCLL